MKGLPVFHDLLASAGCAETVESKTKILSDMELARDLVAVTPKQRTSFESGYKMTQSKACGDFAIDCRLPRRWHVNIDVLVFTLILY